MSRKSFDLPYFDKIFKRSPAEGAENINENIHWGYWDDGNSATREKEDVTRAMIRLTEEVLSRADPKEGQTIADVGCGFGGTLLHISNLIGPAKFKALNIDERQLETAQQNINATLKTEQSCEYYPDDACKLPFTTNSIDLMLAVECAFHFSPRRNFIQHAFRSLKPGGRLVLSDFVVNPMRLHYLWPHILGGASVRKVYGHNPIPWAKIQYEKEGKKAGFSEVICENISHNARPTYDIARYFASETEFFKSFEKANKLMEYYVKNEVIQYFIITMNK